MLEEAHCKYVSSGGPDEELPEFLVAGLKTDHEAFFSALGDYTESESNLSEARVAADYAKFAVECAECALARAKDEKKRRAVCVGPEPAAWAESWEERAPLRVFRMNTRPDSPPMWECVCDLSRNFWSHAEERQESMIQVSLSIQLVCSDRSPCVSSATPVMYTRGPEKNAYSLTSP